MKIIGSSECRIRVDGRHADRLAVAAVSPKGETISFVRTSKNEWHLTSLGHLSEKAEIVIYFTEDRNGGFITQSYPIQVEIGGERYDFPQPVDQLAAVILAKIYLRNGEQRMKVSNEGFTFGVDAYARARNINADMIPNRHRAPAPDRDFDHRPSPDHPPAPPPGNPLGSGSGILVAPGIIATNAHVIEGGSKFCNGRTRQRFVPIAVDGLHDLALLQGDVQGDPLALRSNSPLWLGEPILASGYPLMDLLGTDLKVTTGNISGLKGRDGDVSRFQFTAPIGSGSSGGAIVDENGNLVGVTSASLAHGRIRDTGAISENVNFGIKASLVHELLAASGIDVSDIQPSQNNNRRDVVERLRRSVFSIIVEV